MNATALLDLVRRAAGSLPRGRVRLVGAGLCLAAVAAAALGAPVVVTPGSLASSIFSHDPTGATPSSTLVETLTTCYVTPTADDRTIVLSSRNWSGYTKPITVFYKMVGGGSGVTAYMGNPSPQLGSAGGSSAILKNGAVVAAANGANAAQAQAAVVSGSFTFTSGDTLRFVAGGGGGSGATGYYYAVSCSYPDGYGGYYYADRFQWYSFPGGGGAGYYGGGAGQYYESNCAAPYGPPALAGIATGGTGIAGGVGAPGNGSLGLGGANPMSGYDGGAGGTNAGSTHPAFWNGYSNAYFQVGGGGNKGAPGTPGGSIGPGSYCPQPPNSPAAMPLAKTYDLDPDSGRTAYNYGGIDIYGYNYSCFSGGGRGQIVLRYQAKTCDLIPQYNAQ